jgi:hypothetical protein
MSMEPHRLPTPTFSRQRLCHNRYPRGEAVGFQSFRMRVIYVMGNRPLPPSQELALSFCDTASEGRGKIQ